MTERNHVLLKMILGVGIGCMLAVGSANGVVLAQGTAAEEQTLEKKATTLNGMPASPKLDEARVQALAKEFNVAPSVVEGLRNQKQGWGETTIELAMAQHLAQTDPKTYPTITDALNKVETLRSEKMGWGRIAKDLGFKLGPVIGKVERSETAVRTADREGVERGEGKSKADHLEKASGAERHERLDRPERAERPERPGR
jgi:hypothetical protein